MRYYKIDFDEKTGEIIEIPVEDDRESFVFSTTTNVPIEKLKQKKDENKDEKQTEEKITKIKKNKEINRSIYSPEKCDRWKCEKCGKVTDSLFLDKKTSKWICFDCKFKNMDPIEQKKEFERLIKIIRYSKYKKDE